MLDTEPPVNIEDIVNTILKVTGKTPDVQWDNSKPKRYHFVLVQQNE